MIALLPLKMLFAAALTLGLSNPAVAEELEREPASMALLQREATEYRIDQSPRPVVVGWNAAHPKAFMVTVHGFGLHKFAFEQFALAMQKRDISTYSLDVRGFGGWTANQGSDKRRDQNRDKNRKLSFAKTFDDLTLLVTSIRREHPGKPIFLVGESMGGAIALEYSAQHAELIDGVISAVPGNERFARFRTALQVGTSFLLAGGGSVNLKHVLVDRVFNNEQLKRNWESDSDASLSATLSELFKVTKFMKHAELAAGQIDSLPVLLVQGSCDRLVRPEASEKIFQELKTNDKELIELAKGEHLTFEDGQFDDAMLSRLDHWVTQHDDSAVLTASAR